MPIGTIIFVAIATALLIRAIADAESIETLDRVKGANRQILRSMISPTYANRFIREYIMEVDDDYGHNHEAERKD